MAPAGNYLEQTIVAWHEYQGYVVPRNLKVDKRAKAGFYVEVAHIQPVCKGGQSVIGNLLVLCPNHHKEFDVGDGEILEQSTDMIRGRLNGRDFEIRLPGSSPVPPTQR